MNIGRAGARVASSVILKQGATLSAEEALDLVQKLPNMAKVGGTPQAPTSSSAVQAVMSPHRQHSVQWQ